jgi:hypothetical protein
MTSSARARDRGRDGQARRFDGLEIDYEVKLNRLPDRQVAGPGSLQDAIDVVGRSAVVVRNIRPVDHQAAIIGVFSLRIDRRQACLDESHDVSAVVPEHFASEDNDRVGSGKAGRPQRAQAGDIQCFDRASSSQTQRRGGSLASLKISFWAGIWWPPAAR